MPTFMNLSEIAVNLSAIRYVLPRAAKTQQNLTGCTVFFTDRTEPHVFYGPDAEKLLAFVRGHTVEDAETPAGATGS